MDSRLLDLKRAFDAECRRVEAGDGYASWFKTSPAHDGSPHIALTGNTFHYVVTERGSEFERRQSKDLDVVLYWLMSDVTSDMALKFELRNNRKPEEDFRRQYFTEQERLLRVLRGDWADAFAERIRGILKEHPFSDPGEPR